MDDLERMERALAAADKAGDVAAALQITRDMKAMLQSVNPAVADPTDHAAEGAKALAKETGAGEATMVAAGRKATRVGAGIHDLATGGPSPETKAIRADEDAAYGALQKERPVATLAGEALPYTAVPASMGILPAAATVGAFEAAEPGTAKERLGRGVTGGVATAAGGLLAKAGASFLAPVTKKAAGQSHQSALEAGERIGYRPTLGESTGSSFIRRMEDYAARSPGGGGVMADHAATNQLAVNRAAAKSIGETADELSPEVFANASKRIGKVFEDLKALPGTPIKIGPNVAQAADEVLATQAKMLPHQQDANLIAIAKQAKVLSQNRGAIDGATYQLQRSGLSDASFDATVGTNKQLYGKLLSALDDSADASLRAAGNTALADALRTARPQYANLKILEKGTTAEAGDVSAARVASTMRTNNPGAFRRGSFMGPLRDVASVGEGLKPLKAGSPTFEREAVSNPVSALLNMAWSYPVAKVATSPVVSLYPRTLGKTAAARNVAELVQPSGRAAVAAALQNAGLLPMAAPVATE